MIQLTCKQCNQLFSVKRYRIHSARYCSMRCKVESYKNSDVKKTCVLCNKEFTVKKHTLKRNNSGKYCSSSCYEKRSPKVTMTCECGKKFEAYRSRVSYYSTLYCNNKCKLKYGYKGRLTDETIEMTNYEKFIRTLRSTALYLK